jgi:hypothetical protein
MEPSASAPGDPNANVELKLDYEIEEDVGAELEEFVRLNDEAHQLYQECLSAHQDWFPVMAEFADCLLRECKFSLLSKFITDTTERLLSSSQPQQESQILVLMQAIANYRLTGQLEDTIIKSPSIWATINLKQPFSSPKDTEVKSNSQYHIESSWLTAFRSI